MNRIVIFRGFVTSLAPSGEQDRLHAWCRYALTYSLIFKLSTVACGHTQRTEGRRLR